MWLVSHLISTQHLVICKSPSAPQCLPDFPVEFKGGQYILQTTQWYQLVIIGIIDIVATMIINTRCTCARGLRYLVCVCVCPLSASSIQGLYHKLNISAGFMLISKDFQLTDFSQTLSFKSYSLFPGFYAKSAIL